MVLGLAVIGGTCAAWLWARAERRARRAERRAESLAFLARWSAADAAGLRPVPRDRERPVARWTRPAA